MGTRKEAQITFRLDEDAQARLDALARRLEAEPLIDRATRSSTARLALDRGLDALESELPRKTARKKKPAPPPKTKPGEVRTFDLGAHLDKTRKKKPADGDANQDTISRNLLEELEGAGRLTEDDRAELDRLRSGDTEG